MKDIFTRPAVFYAARTQDGSNLFLEIIQFILVMLIGTLSQLLIMIPFIANAVYKDSRWGQALIDPASMSAVNSSWYQYLTSNRYVILTLCSTIGSIIVILLFCTLIQKRKLSSLGFRKKGFVTEYLIGALAGFVVFSAAVGICLITGAIELKGDELNGAWIGLIFIFIGYLIQGMSEELLLRGFLMVSISRKYSLVLAIVTNSLLFAALHLSNSGVKPLALVNLFLFGVFASVYFIKRGSIWGIAAFHSVWNFVQGNFYGIRVSGNRSGSSIFAAVFQSGHDLINGGDFGLEGGLAVTIVLIIGIVILYFMKGNIDEQEIEKEKQNADQVRQSIQQKELQL